MTYPTATRDEVRTIRPPWPEESNNEAAIQVLMSWLRANHVDPRRLLSRNPIEIHPSDRFGHVIMFREVVTPAPGGRGHEARTTVRNVPLQVEPEGLLADELTCGHVHVAPSPVADADPLNFTCGQGINPADGRHPGDHTGRRSIDPETNRPAGPNRTGYQMTWPNTHPGEHAFHQGMPTAAALERRPRVDRRKALIAIGPHMHALVRIAERHAPHATLNRGIVCRADYVTGNLTTWPCADYRDAAAGIVHFPPAGQ